VTSAAGLITSLVDEWTDTIEIFRVFTISFSPRVFAHDHTIMDFTNRDRFRIIEITVF